MRIHEVDNITFNRKRYESIEEIILEFLESEMRYAEVLSVHEYASTESCYNSYYQTIARLGLRSVMGVTLNYDEVYLYRKEGINAMGTIHHIKPDTVIRLEDPRPRIEKILEFLDSNFECAEIELGNQYCSSNSAQSSWRAILRDMDLIGQLRVRRQAGRLFLMREDRWDLATGDN